MCYVHIQLCILKFYVHLQWSVLRADSFTYFDVESIRRPSSMECFHVLRTYSIMYFDVHLQCCIFKFNKILSIFRIRLRFHVVPPACPGYLFGGGTRPTPPSHAPVVHKFEAVAGSWGSVSAPAVNGVPERNKNSNKYVCINDSNSECLDVKCGVPQGSILGPALFILYVNDMCNVSKSLKSILFADDTNLFYAGKDLDEVCKIISRELNILHIWFQVNKLSLNVAKTNFMIFGNKRFEENYIISINGMNINRVYVTKFLGVHIDSKLNWNEHISVIKTKVAKNIAIMNRVKHCLISSALYSLYCTLILPYLNYCCEIWGNTYKSRIHPLYIMQKRAIRICGNSDYRAHTRPIFYQFKTLCLPDMVTFNSMVFMYKVFNNSLPNNLLVYFKKVNDCHEHNTRKNNVNFKIRFSRTTMKATSLCMKAPKLWNELCNSVKLCTSVQEFKHKYKILLLKK